jgi:hypothetical protein
MLQLAQPSAGRADVAETSRLPRWFGVNLLVLAAALVGNALLGPLVAGVITYPFSETVRNEALGLEVVSLTLVAPLSVVAGVLALRGRPLGAILAFGPTSYTAYMFVQYVAGPGYRTYASSLLLHVALFSLASALFIRAWTLASPALPAMSRKSDHRWALVLLGMSTFVISRWIETLANMVDGAPLADPYLQDPGMYWSIFLLDLGVVVPGLVVSGLALWRGRRWARTALYALVGWFLLVPPSVTAMAITKIVSGDPHANPADTVVLGAATLLFAAVGIALYRPLLRTRHPSP